VPNALPRACEHRPACPNYALPGKTRCAEHLDDLRQRDSDRKSVDPSKHFRAMRAWRDRLSPSVIHQNPICQRLRAGEQCRRPSSVVHHRIGPGGDSRMFFSVFIDGVSQLIALCDICHDEERDPKGTPDWQEGVDYVRTEFLAPNI